MIGEISLYQGTHYPINIFMAEANDGGYLRVTYQDSSGVEKSWKDFLRNLNKGEKTFC